jgi:hypothetical protein
MITVGPGHHVLNFAKEGFRAGTIPLEIGQNETAAAISGFFGGNGLDTITSDKAGYSTNPT